MTDATQLAPPVKMKRHAGGVFGALASSAGRFSGLYLIVTLVLFFCFYTPGFWTSSNLTVIASSQAISGIVTMALLVSLVSGVFDLSVAANMSLSISLVGYLQTEVALDPALAVVATIACGAVIGVLNAIVITVLKVDAIIATLGTSAILAAAAFFIVDGRTLVEGISDEFISWGTATVFGMPITVVYLLVVVLGLWLALEHTPWGRYLRAAGANAEATRLSGVNVTRIQVSALIVSGSLAALAGVVLSAQVGASSFGAGNAYLLPAFAAAFLGTTQIQLGRFNVWGTVIALYLLAIAVKGIQLRHPDLPWIAQLIQGVTLIVAVAVSAHVQRRRS